MLSLLSVFIKIILFLLEYKDKCINKIGNFLKRIICWERLLGQLRFR